jgi:hypothetical protein
MARMLGLTSLVLGLLAFGTADVAAQKKKQVTPEIATDQDYKLLQSIKDMTGKLTSINTMSITFRLDIPHLEPNPKYRPPKGNNSQYDPMYNIYRLQARALAIRNPVLRQIRMQELMATLQREQYLQLMRTAAATGNPNNQPFVLAHQYKDFDLELAEKVVFRKMSLEPQYDDKGNIKEYTKEEKDKLRGKDTSKPGYEAKVEDLEAGQQVKIYLKMPKKTKPLSEPDKAEDKVDDKEKPGDKDKAADKADQAADKAKNKADAAGDKNAKAEIVRPVITMIVILQPPDARPGADVAPANRKKDN